MALFHFRINPIKRSLGQKATAAAAYRAGERIRDERTDTVHNYSRRQDVRHTEIFLPSKFDGAAMEWARDRTKLWNAAEAAENRRNARVAREFQVALPSELNHEQRLELARKFAGEIANRYGIAVDLAVHDPKPDRDTHNFHAHLLCTTRDVTPTGLGAKAGLDMQTLMRVAHGLKDHTDEYSALRERWATLTNDAYRAANLEMRVDHRTLKAQGIDRRPVAQLPMEFYQLERRGVSTQAAERLRDYYRAQIIARQARNEEEAARRALEEAALSGPQGNTFAAKVLAVEAMHAARAEKSAEHATPAEAGKPVESAALGQPSSAPPAARRSADATPDSPPTPKSTVVAEIRRRAVQNWLRIREKALQPDNQRDNDEQTRGGGASRGEGDDHSR